jgi:hypothetical protein
MEIDILLEESKDMGSFVMLYGKTRKKEDVAIPMDYRCFDNMLDSLLPIQRQGKAFVTLIIPDININPF